MEAFFDGSYFHGSYFHERMDGSFHESFHKLRSCGNSFPAPEASAESAVQISAHLAAMGPDFHFAEASMVAASMDASVEVVVIVAHPHRHP